MVERLVRNEKAAGSNPTISTKQEKPSILGGFSYFTLFFRPLIRLLGQFGYKVRTDDYVKRIYLSVFCKISIPRSILIGEPRIFTSTDALRWCKSNLTTLPSNPFSGPETIETV